ncbi:MAG: Preprotein translocase subunit SecD [Microgenomates group bacterium GW2011_GWB1_40_9]|nr:MAG: Protein-export membrane protein SecD [Microgenomates group bacterium GW2011_GWC1_39_12]KKR79286.1 MAG: Preprotein translocase subunit SecD [Microgenomates group bacterium GW2011_GWB1_40_9]
MKQTKKVFSILVILAMILIIVDLPENYKLTIPFFGKSQTFTINPPAIDTTIVGIHIKKDFKTRLGLDLAGGTQLTLEADMTTIPQVDRKDSLESAKQVIERRVNFFGVSEPVIQTALSGEKYRIVVELPGVTNTNEAIALVGQTAQLEFREHIKEPIATESGFVIPTIENTVAVGITGRDLKKSLLQFNAQSGEPEVGIQFTPEGSKKFADVTKRLIGKRLAIFLDNIVVTDPTVNTEIADGQAVITGSFTVDAAKQLAIQLNAGALPVPVKIVEKRTIGASLGADSVTKSVRAGMIGLGLVAAFMIVQYGWLGFLADIALCMYGLITLFLYRFIPVTLTLPGIAGFILSIGMAVDSNILIFSRYKEELRRGKPWQIAMELGFGKAWESIRDANFTTIITSIILFNPGNWPFLPTSGLVRGFAATLFLGVITSLFTGIVVTRTLIRMFYKGK